jgi:hypothetical protein
MSVPDREADENAVCTGETPSIFFQTCQGQTGFEQRRHDLTNPPEKLVHPVGIFEVFHPFDICHTRQPLTRMSNIVLESLLKGQGFSITKWEY